MDTQLIRVTVNFTNTLQPAGIHDMVCYPDLFNMDTFFFNVWMVIWVNSETSIETLIVLTGVMNFTFQAKLLRDHHVDEQDVSLNNQLNEDIHFNVATALAGQGSQPLT